MAWTGFGGVVVMVVRLRERSGLRDFQLLLLDPLMSSMVADSFLVSSFWVIVALMKKWRGWRFDSLP